MREKLTYWTLKLRQERNLRRRALTHAPERVSYHRQREEVMTETIGMLKSAIEQPTDSRHFG